MNSIRNNLHFLLPLLAVVMLLACAQNTPEAVFNRGLRAFEEGDFLGASIYFEEYTNKFPEGPQVVEAHIALAQCFIRIQDFASARSVYEDMKEQFDNPQVTISADFGIGQTYFQEGFTDKAIESFESIINSTTDTAINIRAYNSLAQIYAQQTEMEKAEETYDTIYNLADTEIENPTEALDVKIQTLSSKAQIYQASQEFEQARATHQKILDVVNNATGISGLEADKQNAVINWAHTYAWAGDYVSAATIYDQLHDNQYIHESVKPQLIMYKIQSLERLFFNEEGEEQYSPEESAVLVQELQRLTENYPNTEQGVAAMTQVAQLVKDSTPEMAEQYLNQAIEKFEQQIAEPDSPQRPIMAMLSIADAYIRTENYDKAKQALERVMQTYSNVPQAVQRAQSMLNYIKRMEAEGAQAAAGVQGATGTVRQQAGSIPQPGEAGAGAGSADPAEEMQIQAPGQN